jgi:hypothetical protein
MCGILYTKKFTSNAKRLDGSSSSMDFVDGSADAATAPVIDVFDVEILQVAVNLCEQST